MKKFHPSFRFWMIAVTAVLITVSGICFGQKWYFMLPLYISLYIMLLQTRANRYAFLLGGINSILYAVLDFSLQLYGAALYDFFFSFPLQVITFFNWRRHAYGNSTIMKRLTARQRLFWLGVCVAAWLVLELSMQHTDASPAKRMMDNASTVLGVAGTVASMFSLIEFPLLQIISHAIFSFPLRVMVTVEDPAQITYLVFLVYSTVCACMSARTMHALYCRQQEEANNHLE